MRNEDEQTSSFCGHYVRVLKNSKKLSEDNSDDSMELVMLDGRYKDQLKIKKTYTVQ